MAIDADTLSAIQEAVKEAVKTTVNGKIDALRKTNDEGMADINRKIEAHNESHEKDMAEIKPVIQFVTGTKMLGEIVKWLASVAIAWLALKGFFNGFIGK